MTDFAKEARDLVDAYYEQRMSGLGTLSEALARRMHAAGVAEEIARSRDGAYEERNRVVAALARLFPSGLKDTNIPGWEPEWHGCVYIDLPTGQASWHFHDSQRHLFAGLPPYAGEWDGHTTEEKYRRLEAILAAATPGKNERG